jgi:hypothetical protein
MRVTNDIPLGVRVPVDTVNCVQTLQAATLQAGLDVSVEGYYQEVCARVLLTSAGVLFLSLSLCSCIGLCLCLCPCLCLSASVS